VRIKKIWTAAIQKNYLGETKMLEKELSFISQQRPRVTAILNY